MSLENKFNKSVQSSSTTPSDWQKKAAERARHSKFRKRTRQIALRVLQALKDQNISQSELAEKMGVTRQHVSKIVKGQENFTFETVEKLENALDIELIMVFGPRMETDFPDTNPDHFVPAIAISSVITVMSGSDIVQLANMSSQTTWFLERFMSGENLSKAEENTLMSMRLCMNGSVRYLVDQHSYKMQQSEFAHVIAAFRREARVSNRRDFVDTRNINYRQLETS